MRNNIVGIAVVDRRRDQGEIDLFLRCEQFFSACVCGAFVFLCRRGNINGFFGLSILFSAALRVTEMAHRGLLRAPVSTVKAQFVDFRSVDGVKNC